MELTYDPTNNVGYIRFSEKGIKIADTVPAGEVDYLDLETDGTLYGLELLSANTQLRRGDAGRLVIKDQSSGRQVEIQLFPRLEVIAPR